MTDIWVASWCPFTGLNYGASAVVRDLEKNMLSALGGWFPFRLSIWITSERAQILRDSNSQFQFSCPALLNCSLKLKPHCFSELNPAKETKYLGHQGENINKGLHSSPCWKDVYKTIISSSGNEQELYDWNGNLILFPLRWLVCFHSSSAVS